MTNKDPIRGGLGGPVSRPPQQEEAIQMVLSSDANYAMPMAVAICSAAAMGMA